MTRLVNWIRTWFCHHEFERSRMKRTQVWWSGYERVDYVVSATCVKCLYHRLIVEAPPWWTP